MEIEPAMLLPKLASIPALSIAATVGLSPAIVYGGAIFRSLVGSTWGVGAGVGEAVRVGVAVGVGAGVAVAVATGDGVTAGESVGAGVVDDAPHAASVEIIMSPEAIR
jgi:hypothetical protein